jgi:hypothetical protein
MKKSIVYILIIFIFLPGFLSAQVRLYGMVNDSATQKPIPFCSFLVKGTTTGGITDDRGNFSVQVDHLPVALIFNSLGYTTKTVVVSNNELLKINLSPSGLSLNPVTITSEKVHTWHAEDAWTYVDFDFYDNYILSLVAIRGKKGNYLVLSDTLGEQVALLRVNNQADSLYTDCLGKIHLCAGDSIYQVYYDYEKLSLPYVSERKTFCAEMLPCRCETGPYYYFSFASHHHQQVDYYYINWYEKGQYNHFLTVADSAKITGFNQDYDLNYFLERRRLYQEYAEPVDSIVKHMDMYREQLPLSLTEQSWLSPVGSPLVMVKGNVYIVNTIDSTLNIYSGGGELRKKVPFDCLKIKGWQSNELYADALTGLLYGRVVGNNGSSIFVSIDPQTGKETGRVTIEKFAYITSPKILGGNIYFLWKDPYSEQPVKLRVMGVY